MKRRELPRLDVALTTDEVVAESGVEREASSLGVVGLPKAGETERAPSQRRAVELVDMRRNDRNEEVAYEIEEVSALVAGGAAAIETRVADVVLERTMAVLATLAAMIVVTFNTARLHAAQFNAFQLEHDLLHRSARFPASKIRWWSLLIVLALIESLLAAGMYFGTGDSGLVGAVAVAISVSALNIFIAATVGIAFLYATTLPTLRGLHRWWAIPSIIIGSILIIYINLYAAYFREAGIAGAEHPELESLKNLWANPGTLSLTSTALLLAGIGCALLAAWKAARSTDSAIGYEFATRDRDDSAADAADLTGHIQAELEAVGLHEIGDRQAVVRTFGGMLSEARRRESALTSKSARNERVDAQEIRAAEGADAVFKRANLRVRQDGASPAVFATRIDWQAGAPPPLVNDLASRIAAAETKFVAGASARQKDTVEARRRMERVQDHLDEILLMISDAGKSGGADGVVDLSAVRAFIVAGGPANEVDQNAATTTMAEAAE